jgi:DNA-binding transcriptional ArsR family regulator
MKLVKIIDDGVVAKLLSDPMRRAILNILREAPLTEAGLADRLGLTDATVNYHLALLKNAKLVALARKEAEGHGIVQKFYLPSAYLYLPDTENLEREFARYYLPINIERIRGAVSAKHPGHTLSGEEIDRLGEEFAKLLVRVARKYEETEVAPGRGEHLVNGIYSEALESLPPLRKRP